MDLPEPAGPVTTINPLCNMQNFFNTDGNAYSHVGIYVNNDQFVHAPSQRTGRVLVSSLKNQYSSQLKSGRIDIEKMKLIAGFPSTDGSAKSSGALFRSNDHTPTLQSIILKMDTYELWVGFAPQGKLPMKPSYLQIFSGDPFSAN